MYRISLYRSKINLSARYNLFRDLSKLLYINIVTES
jgi:hypothetical protein